MGLVCPKLVIALIVISEKSHFVTNGRTTNVYITNSSSGAFVKLKYLLTRNRQVTLAGLVTQAANTESRFIDSG